MRACVVIMAVAAFSCVFAANAQDRRPVLPDHKSIDSLQYTYSAGLFQGQAVLIISRHGDVRYSYQSQPHTGSGGKVVQKNWKLPPKEAVALLDDLVAAGLLELPDNGHGHYFELTHGRWRMSLMRRGLPEKIAGKLLPLLQHADAALWKERKPADMGFI